MIERDEKLIAEVRSFVPELEVVPDEVVESLWAQWSDKEYCAGWMYPDGPLAMKFRKHYLDHPAVEVLLEHVKEAERKREEDAYDGMGEDT